MSLRLTDTHPSIVTSDCANKIKSTMEHPLHSVYHRVPSPARRKRKEREDEAEHPQPRRRTADHARGRYTASQGHVECSGKHGSIVTEPSFNSLFEESHDDPLQEQNGSLYHGIQWTSDPED